MSNLEPFEQPGSAVQISGDSVVVSSGAVSIVSGSITVNSGTVAVSGLYTGFSGSFLSGAGAVSGAMTNVIYAYDYSGSTWNRLSVAASGSSTLNVNATFTATGLQVSGTVQISGNVNVGSGTIGVSGLFAGFSGGAGFQSGAGAVSGAIPVIPFAWDYSGVKFNPLMVGRSGVNMLATQIYGRSVNAAVQVQDVTNDFPSADGYTTTSVVGMDTLNFPYYYDQIANVWNRNKITQDYVWTPLSGIGFGAGATNSGIPSLSGGVSLSSGKVVTAIVRNLSGNADMYLGGSGSRPFSGFGFILHGGDGLTLNINNFNLIYLFANTSGQLVSYIGTAFN